jgi:fructokinase
MITLGAEGCFYCYPGGTGRLPAYRVKAVDTTGAGDAFLGGVLYWLSRLTLAEIATLSRVDFETIIDFAGAAGALTTTKTGAIPALPDIGAVRECMKNITKY